VWTGGATGDAAGGATGDAAGGATGDAAGGATGDAAGGATGDAAGGATRGDAAGGATRGDAAGGATGGDAAGDDAAGNDAAGDAAGDSAGGATGADHLSYLEARRRLYAPAYAAAAEASPAYAALVDLYRSGMPIGLVDFDGWDHVGQGYSLAEALREPRVKFGHAFVLAGMLTGERVWEE